MQGVILTAEYAENAEEGKGRGKGETSFRLERQRKTKLVLIFPEPEKEERRFFNYELHGFTLWNRPLC